jgi:regulation of enolase protein 1 (concanavalin A-like superfamily)
MPLADWIWLRPPNLQAEVGDGQLIMRPDGGGWHDRRQAMLLYTRMTGDFVIEVTVQAVSRDDPNMPPRTPYNVAGLLVRSPLGGEENWVMVAIGEMDGQAGLESKFTTNGDSVRDEIAGPTSGRLRICRQGSQFTHLHWLDGAAGWETFAPGGAQTSRPDLLGEVQVGLVAGGWDEASIEARFRQVRLGRPARCDGPLP